MSEGRKWIFSFHLYATHSIQRRQVDVGTQTDDVDTTLTDIESADIIEKGTDTKEVTEQLDL